MFVAARTCSIEELAALPPNTGADDDISKKSNIQGDQASVLEDDCSGRDCSIEWRNGLMDSMELPCLAKTFSLPSQVYEKLHPYQRSGVAWLAQLFCADSGGILADEMGLGKTVQICSFLEGARRAGATHVLVLLPVTLMEQWRDEVHKWCPSWAVFIYHGTPAQRLRSLNDVMQTRGGILLTSYSIFSKKPDLLKHVQLQTALSTSHVKGRRCKRQRRHVVGSDHDVELDDDAQSLELDFRLIGRPKPWDVVICDEAHKMKNVSTLLGRSLRSIQARSRFLLTGTPVQNSLQDLWGLMDFAQQGLLGNRATFVKQFSDPINHGSVRGASSYAVGLKKHLCQELWQLVSPHLLRRSKLSVGLLADGDGGDLSPETSAVRERDACNKATLPPKYETILWLMPTDDQTQVYKHVLKHSDLVRKVSAKTKLGVDVFQVIGVLKRLCNHPMLTSDSSERGEWQELLSQVEGREGALEERDLARNHEAIKTEIVKEELVEAGEIVKKEVAKQEPRDADLAQRDGSKEVEACASLETATLIRNLPRNKMDLIQQSAKLRCLAKLLPALAGKGHRILVFAQSVKMLDLVEVCVLRDSFLGHMRIDGQTSVQSRAEIVQQFQTEYDKWQCLLLTTSVGGVGLNLTAADRVVIIDPAWNPQTDAQAVDRVFRIGQQREVRIYRLVMSGLIEDKMFRLQVFKMGLTRTALEAKSQQHYFTTREIRGLFDWTDPSEGETRKLLVDSHGEDLEESTKHRLAEDGIDEVASQDACIIGLSNFAALYTSLVHDKESDACHAQIAEMKKRLSDAESQLQHIAEMQHVASGSLDDAKKQFEEAGRKISAAVAARTKHNEELASKQLELNKIKRMHAVADQRLKKALQAEEKAKMDHSRLEHRRREADKDLEGQVTSVYKAKEAMLSSAKSVSDTIDMIKRTLAAVGSNARRASDCLVEAADVGLQATHKSLELLCQDLATMETTRCELQLMHDELRRADLACTDTLLEKSGNKDDPRNFSNGVSVGSWIGESALDETRFELCQARAKQEQDRVSQCVQTLVGAGHALVKSFRSAKSKQLNAQKLVAIKANATTSFSRLQETWQAMQMSQSEWVKASLCCREPRRRAAIALAHVEAAAHQLTLAEELTRNAALDESLRRDKLSTRELEIQAEEKARADAEASEAVWRSRRDEMRARLGTAHLEALKSKAAAQEANDRRSALQAWCARTENLHLQFEASKFSAVEALRAETYNERQVEDAYQARKRQRQD